MENKSLSTVPDRSIERLIDALGILSDGGRAETMLMAAGQRAVPCLRSFLLDTSPRTIAEPRCRAARALGQLGAYSALVAYFREYQPPADAAVLFAEDAVRSAVARELLQWKSQETFEVLLDAAQQRATSGLIFALGEYCRPESAPLLFRMLEDDLCREDAMNALRQIPDVARQYALRSIGTLADSDTRGGSAQWRCRATFRLLLEFGVPVQEWRHLCVFIRDKDADVVLSAAQIGFRIAPPREYPDIIQALIKAADKFNGLQEQDAITLLSAYSSVARNIALDITRERNSRGSNFNWQMPSWRILQALINAGVEVPQHRSA